MYSISMVDLFWGQSLLCAVSILEKQLDGGKVDGRGIGIYLEQFDGCRTEKCASRIEREQFYRLCFWLISVDFKHSDREHCDRHTHHQKHSGDYNLSITIHGPSPSLPALVRRPADVATCQAGSTAAV
jgi:hypothetical protein